MKKFILILTCALYAFGASAQETSSGSVLQKNESNYCATVLNGKIVVTHDGQLILEPVTLNSGAVLTLDGKIISKDKSKTELQNGECIDMYGIIYCDEIVENSPVQNEEIITGDNGYKLPEVQVAAEKIQGTKIISSDKNSGALEQNSSSFEFKDFIVKMKTEIETNEKDIASVKLKLLTYVKEDHKKQIRKINSLEIENNELKSDLENYIAYGTGNWKIFRKEFIQDAEALSQDLNNIVFFLMMTSLQLLNDIKLFSHH